MELQGKTALIVGAGSGLSASVARALAAEGMRLALAARRPERVEELAESLGGNAFECDAADTASVATLFTAVEAALGAPSVVVFNPSARVQGALVDLAPAEVAQALAVTAMGGFLVGQQAAQRMLAAGEGVILFTGASASVKGYPRSAPFAMGKFALRGLAQSMARELHPQGIHVGHVVIDGGIGRSSGDAMLDPDGIAASYVHLARQPRSTWAWEIELRPWVERF